MFPNQRQAVIRFSREQKAGADSFHVSFFVRAPDLIRMAGNKRLPLCPALRHNHLL
jgi:hypothetical protein